MVLWILGKRAEWVLETHVAQVDFARACEPILHVAILCTMRSRSAPNALASCLHPRDAARAHGLRAGRMVNSPGPGRLSSRVLRSTCEVPMECGRLHAGVVRVLDSTWSWLSVRHNYDYPLSLGRRHMAFRLELDRPREHVVRAQPGLRYVGTNARTPKRQANNAHRRLRRPLRCHPK